LWLEELEPRTVPTTITRTSASIFYNDFSAAGAPLTSAYAAYQITNTDGVNYADVWATIGNFTSASGPVAVMLGANAASAIDLGPLANGQTKTAFFYLGSTADTNVTQTHTVSVFNGPPTSGSLLTSQNFSFAAVQDTTFANSNKVSSVVVSPSTPTIGGAFTITVTGNTSNVGAPPVLDFTPAAYLSWRADAFQLTGTTITFSNGNTGRAGRFPVEQDVLLDRLPEQGLSGAAGPGAATARRQEELRGDRRGTGLGRGDGQEVGHRFQRVGK
jgi:hypothetical protein